MCKRLEVAAIYQWKNFSTNSRLRYISSNQLTITFLLKLTLVQVNVESDISGLEYLTISCSRGLKQVINSLVLYFLVCKTG